MRKKDAIRICDYVADNYDMPMDQVEWYDFSEFLLGMVVRYMNSNKCGKEFCERYPFFFKSGEEV